MEITNKSILAAIYAQTSKWLILIIHPKFQQSSINLSGGLSIYHLGPRGIARGRLVSFLIFFLGNFAFSPESAGCTLCKRLWVFPSFDALSRQTHWGQENQHWWHGARLALPRYLSPKSTARDHPRDWLSLADTPVSSHWVIYHSVKPSQCFLLHWPRTGPWM